MTPSSETLARYIGRRLKATRGRRRQEDLAADLTQLLGEPWERATVAALETGRRALRLGDVLLVCVAYETTIPALLDDDEQMLQVAGREVSAFVLKQALGVAAPPVPPHWAPGTGAGGTTDADRRAAKQLGLSVAQVRVRADELWGRTLEAERDSRAARRATGDDRATRGHVTRELLAELRRAGGDD